MGLTRDTDKPTSPCSVPSVHSTLTFEPVTELKMDAAEARVEPFPSLHGHTFLLIKRDHVHHQQQRRQPEKCRVLSPLSRRIHSTQIVERAYQQCRCYLASDHTPKPSPHGSAINEAVSTISQSTQARPQRLGFWLRSFSTFIKSLFGSQYCTALSSVLATCSCRLCTIGRSLIPQPDCFHFPPCALFCSVPHPAISTVTCALFLLLIPGASHQSQGSLPRVHLILVWMLLAELRRFASALKASPKTRSNTQLT